MSYESKKCKAHSSRTGKQCGNWALPGLTVCRTHGGAQKTARAKSERFLADQAAEKRLAQLRDASLGLGVLVELSPAEAITQEVWRSAGLVRFYEEQLQRLEDTKDLVWGLTEDRDGWTKGDMERMRTHTAGVNVWLQLYNREREHLVKVSKVALDAGIDQAKLKLAENQGLMIAQMLNRVLDALLLTDAQRAIVGEVVPRELRSLASAATEAAA